MFISIFTCLQQVVRCNYTSLERKALVELTSYVKGVGTMMERVDTVVADSIWEVLHAQVQEFVQNKLAIMLRTTFKKKKDLSRYIIALANILFYSEHHNARRKCTIWNLRACPWEWANFSCDHRRLRLYKG